MKRLDEACGVALTLIAGFKAFWEGGADGEGCDGGGLEAELGFEASVAEGVDCEGPEVPSFASLLFRICRLVSQPLRRALCCY